MKQTSKILRIVPGMGPVLCTALIGEMPELDTINDQQIAALDCVAPINKDSGCLDGRRAIVGEGTTYGAYCIRPLSAHRYTTNC